MGAIVEFRAWSKIETQMSTSTITSKDYTKLAKQIKKSELFVKRCMKYAPGTKIKSLFADALYSYRQKYINKFQSINSHNKINSISLFGDVQNDGKKVTMLIDVKNGIDTLYRDSIDIPSGSSFFMIPLPPLESKEENYYVNIHPADAEKHITLIFNSLELKPTDFSYGKKVKCVVWDLDNTLWDGILIEDKNVRANTTFIELIKQLDGCGIVNSIVSKNDENEAIEKLKELEIDEYFVFKKINWEPKSVNINKTIHQMNINPDTVVFVDDNPFERHEVAIKQPKITCIDPSELLDFVKCDRFKMVVTEDSKKRRETYKLLESQKKEEENWKGDIDDFLKSCSIKLTISSPTEETLPRCYELLQRTNQLNSSGRRLSLEEVRFIVESKDFETYVLHCSDRFGNYGIVGFMIVDMRNDIPVITDFVISCRVANKKIEPTLINYLANKYKGKVLFNYKKTSRNGPMYKIIEDLKMKSYSSNDEVETFVHQYNETYLDVVSLSSR